MKNYYQEKIDVFEEQLRLCQKGFVIEMKSFGNYLLNCDNADDVCEKHNHIVKMRKVLTDIESSLASARSSLQEYINKEKADKEKAVTDDE
jgi:hypothetical protein